MNQHRLSEGKKGCQCPVTNGKEIQLGAIIAQGIGAAKNILSSWHSAACPAVYHCKLHLSDKGSILLYLHKHITTLETQPRTTGCTHYLNNGQIKSDFAMPSAHSSHFFIKHYFELWKETYIYIRQWRILCKVMCME